MVGDILQPTHLLFVLVVALLVLGPKRLPEVAKTLGKGIRDFRGAISGDSDPTDHTAYLSGDNGDHHEAPAATQATAAPPAQTAAATPQPVQPAGEPVQPISEPVQPISEPVQPVATPATTAAPAQTSPPQPPPADDGDAQTRPAAVKRQE